MARLRGLSEVVGSLIVLVMISIAALTYVSIYREASRGIEKAAATAVEAVEDRFSAPIMMPDIMNSDLVLHIIPVRPIEVKYAVLASNDSIDVVNVSSLITSMSTLVLKRNYNCEPVFISLITDAGVILRYSPLRDPRVDHGDLTLQEVSILVPGYVDCKIIELLKSMGTTSSNQTTVNETVIYDGQEKYVVLLADPPSYSVAVDPNDVYTVDYVNIMIDGVLTAGRADLTFKARDGQGLLLGQVKLVVTGDGAQQSYLFSLPTSQGRVVPVYARVACSISSCVAGLFFGSNGTVIITGYATVLENVKYDMPLTRCPYSKLEFTLPLVLAPESNFTSTTAGTCAVQWGIHVSLTGQASGHFETWGPLILAASTTANANISVSANLWIRETIEVAVIRPASILLPVNGPIAYSLIPVSVTPRDDLTRSILNFINDNVDDVKLVVSTEGLRAERPVTTDQGIIPLQGANYTLEASLQALTPFTSKIIVDYASEQQLASITYYEWNVTSIEAPLPDPRSLPLLVKVEPLEDPKKYIVVITRAGLTVEQGGTRYQGLAPLLGGAPALLAPVDSATSYFIIQANGSIATAIEVRVSILYDPSLDRTMPIDLFTGAFTTPRLQGIYLIVAVDRESTAQSQNTPPIVLIVVY